MSLGELIIAEPWKDNFHFSKRCFLLIWRTLCHFHQSLNYCLQTLSVWKSPNLSFGKGLKKTCSNHTHPERILDQWKSVSVPLLTLSQTTSSRLFQTERVCRRQFQI